MNTQSHPLAPLLADEPAADRAEKMMLYGQFVGAWDATVTIHNADGTTRSAPAEIHFGWVLEGRAVQDVWIVPSRAARAKDASLPVKLYGTTLRIYDPGIDAWHIRWINPPSQQFDSMIGRADGHDIVQLGQGADGNPIRWSFREITPTSFHWTGERSVDGGKNWRLEGEFHARRIG